MKKKIIVFLVSLLILGFGYLENGFKKYYFLTIGIFFSFIFFGATCRLFTSFKGLFFIIASFLFVCFFSAINSMKMNSSHLLKAKRSGLLKLFLTTSFLLVTGLSFANRRTVLGFDIMSMGVPVMQPTVVEGEQFLVDTWAYKNRIPRRGDIIVHSFNGQKGLYLNRIIAKEHDKIEIRDGMVLLNGEVLAEPYVLVSNARRKESINMKAISVPPNQYFVVGDNRDASFGDSRFSGTISLRNIEGKVTDIIRSDDRSRIGMTLK